MTYFDNAATSFPKPVAVADAMRRCVTSIGGNPGRGAHSLSLAAAKLIFECRSEAAELFGATEPDRVFFTPNATVGINTVLKGLLKRGDHVIISDMEHNAVYRPVYKLAARGVIEYDIFKTYTNDDRQDPLRICASIASLIKPNTKMVFCLHSSNVCSEVLPIERIGEFCHKHGLLFCVDGAQSAGHEHIDVGAQHISALCLPGHKGLYGTQGSGLVVLGDGVSLDTLVEGGSGVDSLSPDMPACSPERYEAGTVATPCIAGLCEGIRYVRTRGIDEIAHAERNITHRIRELLGNTERITLYAPRYEGATVLFNVDGVPSELVCEALDAHGICVRGGYHCAALAHKTLKTPDGGAVRVSAGAFNKPAEADLLYRILRSVTAELCR